MCALVCAKSLSTHQRSANQIEIRRRRGQVRVQKQYCQPFLVCAARQKEQLSLAILDVILAIPEILIVRLIAGHTFGSQLGEIRLIWNQALTVL